MTPQNRTPENGTPLERRRRLVSDGTAGPWRVRVTKDGRDPEVYVTGLMSREGRDPDTVPPKFYVAFLPPMAPGDSEADAALIVAMRSDYPALLDLWEAAADMLYDAAPGDVPIAYATRLRAALQRLEEPG